LNLQGSELPVLLELNTFFQIVSKTHQEPRGCAESRANGDPFTGSAHLIAHNGASTGTPTCAQERTSERFIGTRLRI
jgi:hypothetical protein